MNTMNIPGFTAETSLYKTSGRYRSLGQRGELQSGVIPQMWIIEFLVNLLFGDGGAASAGAAVGGGIGGALCGAWCAGVGAGVGQRLGREVDCYIKKGRGCRDD